MTAGMFHVTNRVTPASDATTPLLLGLGIFFVACLFFAFADSKTFDVVGLSVQVESS
jgi:hypothetical protein